MSLPLRALIKTTEELRILRFTAKITGRRLSDNMRKFSLRAAAGLLAAVAAVFVLSACGDKTADNKETTAPATTIAVTQATTASQMETAAPATETQKQESSATDTQNSQADSGSEKSNPQNSNSSGNQQSSSDESSSKASSGHSSGTSDKSSADSSSSAPASTIVIDNGEKEIVIEQGENELPFIPN